MSWRQFHLHRPFESKMFVSAIKVGNSSYRALTLHGARIKLFCLQENWERFWHVSLQSTHTTGLLLFTCQECTCNVSGTTTARIDLQKASSIREIQSNLSCRASAWNHRSFVGLSKKNVRRRAKHTNCVRVHERKLVTGSSLFSRNIGPKLNFGHMAVRVRALRLRRYPCEILRWIICRKSVSAAPCAFVL